MLVNIWIEMSWFWVGLGQGSLNNIYHVLKRNKLTLTSARSLRPSGGTGGSLRTDNLSTHLVKISHSLLNLRVRILKYYHPVYKWHLGGNIFTTLRPRDDHVMDTWPSIVIIMTKLVNKYDIFSVKSHVSDHHCWLDSDFYRRND